MFSGLFNSRYRVLFLWWLTHAFVGGISRVIFESEFPRIIESKLLNAADLPALLQAGTIVTIVAKLAAGPVSSLLGPWNIGWISLFTTGTIILCCGLNLLPVFMAWCMMRACQSCTWPASNSLIDAWFDTDQHGRAWGIMSTSSRSGIMFVTAALAIFGSTVSNNFIAVGTGGVFLSVIIAFCLQEEPLGRGSTTSSSTSFSTTTTTTATTIRDVDSLNQKPMYLWTEVVQSTFQQPTFYLAVLVQATVTPVAEFQSQLPLWLSSNNATSSFINQGVASWHLGVLSSVVIAGVLFDKSSPLQRGFLLGVPMLFNAFLFYIALSYPGHLMDLPWLKLFISFLLGASYAPANYLMMTTWAMRYATRRAMPIASAGVDVCGYIGTVVLLQLQARSHSTNPTTTLMKYLSLSGLLCSAASMLLFSIEARHTVPKNAAKKRQ